MNKHIHGLAAMTLLVAWIGLPSSAQADPPPWAPAHGYRAKEYRYVYYPHHEVYYAPATQHWFWLDGGRWRDIGRGVFPGPGPDRRLRRWDRG